jgi:hypothetical protein
MAKLNADVRLVFQMLYDDQPLTDYSQCRDFVVHLMKKYTNDELAKATNCEETNFSIWRLWGSPTRRDSQFQRNQTRVQTWLNQHLETETPKPLPADIAIWVTLASCGPHQVQNIRKFLEENKIPVDSGWGVLCLNLGKGIACRVFIPFDSRVQDIPKFLLESKLLPIRSELDVESLTLGEETMEWTRLCSSYSFAYPNLVVVHLSTE